MIIRHRFHLVPLPFPLLGLLEGVVVAVPTGMCSYSSTIINIGRIAAAQQQQYSLRTRHITLHHVEQLVAVQQ